MKIRFLTLTSLAAGMLLTGETYACTFDPRAVIPIKSELSEVRTITMSTCQWFVAEGVDALRVTVEEMGPNLALLIGPPSAPIALDTPVTNAAGNRWLETAMVEANDSGQVIFGLTATGSGDYTSQFRLHVYPSDFAGVHSALLSALAITESITRTSADPGSRKDPAQFAEAARLWSLAGYRREAAWMHLAQGRVSYDNFGDLGGFVDALEAGLALFRPDEPDPTRLQLIAELVTLLINSGRRHEVTSYLDSAISLADEQADKRLVAHLQILRGLYYHTGDALDLARAEYEKARQLLSRHSDPYLEAMLHNNLAGIHYLLGEPRAAFGEFEQAVELLDRVGDKEGRAHILVNSASLRSRIGQYDRALDMLFEAGEIFHDLGQKADVGHIQVVIGKTYLALGEPGRAIEYLQMAEVNARLVDSRGVAANVYLPLGNAYRARGDLAAARTAYARAAEFFIAAGQEADLATVQIALAADALEDQAPHEAIRQLEPAIARLRSLSYRRELASALQLYGVASYQIDEWTAAEDALSEAAQLQQALQELQAQATSLTWRARVLAETGRLAQAIDLAEFATNLLEQARQEVSNPDLRASLFGAHLEPIDELVRLQMMAHMRDPSSGHSLAALIAADRKKARALRDSLSLNDENYSTPDEFTRARAELVDQINGKLMRLRTLNREVDRYMVDPGSPESSSVARQQVISAQIADTESSLRRFRLELASLDARASVAKGPLEAIQPLDPTGLARTAIQNLHPDTGVLIFHLGDPDSYAWLVHKGNVTTERLPPAKTIESYARQCFESASHWEQDTQPLRATLEWLAQTTLRLVERAPPFKHLLIVPDGALHLVPFAALPFSVTGTGTTPLFEAFDLAYLPAVNSISQEPTAGTPPSAVGRIAVFADAVFDRNALRTLYRGAGASGMAMTAILEQLGPLPFSLQEAAAIRNLTGDRADLFTGTDASKAAFRRVVNSQYDIIHVATHAISDMEHPEYSGLVLSLFDEQGRPIDGLVHLQEIYGLQVNAELVVLSACRTGMGRNVPGEGPISLGRAFLLAGAKRVLIARWDVPDDVTASLFEHFYKGMSQKGMSASAALGFAQKMISSDQKLRHPVYWAGFKLITRVTQ